MDVYHDDAGGSTGSARRWREPPCILKVCTDERRNGHCRVSAPQRKAPAEGKGPSRSSSTSSRSPLLEPQGPQERVQRCTVVQLVDFAPMVQILDDPVPLMVGVARGSLPVLGHHGARAGFRCAQDLTRPNHSALCGPCSKPVEQNVDIPVPGCGGSSEIGGHHGFLPEQSSTAPVTGRGVFLAMEVFKVFTWDRVFSLPSSRPLTFFPVVVFLIFSQVRVRQLLPEFGLKRRFKGFFFFRTFPWERVRSGRQVTAGVAAHSSSSTGSLVRSSAVNMTFAGGSASGTRRISVTAGGCLTTRIGPGWAWSYGGPRER